MTTFEPQTQLSFEILEAIIRKTGFALRNTNPTLYECETFTWSPGSKIAPTLSIKTGIEDIPVVAIYWNGELTDKIEIHSNIPWSAEDAIKVYIATEQAVYNQLAKIASTEVQELIIPGKYLNSGLGEYKVHVEIEPTTQEPIRPPLWEE